VVETSWIEWQKWPVLGRWKAVLIAGMYGASIVTLCIGRVYYRCVVDDWIGLYKREEVDLIPSLLLPL